MSDYLLTNLVLQESFLHCFDPLKASESREHWAETLIPSPLELELDPSISRKQ